MTEEELRKEFENNPVPKGEMRRFEKCVTCGQVSVREFIPYGVGRGRTYNACLCRLTGNDKKGHKAVSEERG